MSSGGFCIVEVVLAFGKAQFFLIYVATRCHLFLRFTSFKHLDFSHRKFSFHSITRALEDQLRNSSSTSRPHAIRRIPSPGRTPAVWIRETSCKTSECYPGNYIPSISIYSVISKRTQKDKRAQCQKETSLRKALCNMIINMKPQRELNPNMPVDRALLFFF